MAGMEQREKLIEVLNQFRDCIYDEEIDCNYCDYKDVGECVNTRLADHILTNGVVVLPCRCFECDYHDHDGAVGYCNYWRRWSNMSDYCNHGKRKGGE